MRSRETSKTEMGVLSSGYSKHTKPFHMVAKDGHEHYLFRLQTEGFCRVTVDGKLTRVAPGDLLLYPGNAYYELVVGDEVQHDGRSYTSSTDYFIFFSGAWASTWWRKQLRPQKMNVVANDGIMTLFRQIVMEHRRSNSDSPRLLEWFMKILCVTIDRALSEQTQRKDNTYMAYRIRSYIEEHITSAFQLADVAQYADISVSTAVHMFKATFGQSIMQYAVDLRLAMARERILFSAMPLEHIAEMSGFASYTYFHRIFRSRYGMSPRQYRITQGGR